MPTKHIFKDRHATGRSSAKYVDLILSEHHPQYLDSVSMGNMLRSCIP